MMVRFQSALMSALYSHLPLQRFYELALESVCSFIPHLAVSLLQFCGQAGMSSWSTIHLSTASTAVCSCTTSYGVGQARLETLALALFTTAAMANLFYRVWIYGKRGHLGGVMC